MGNCITLDPIFLWWLVVYDIVATYDGNIAHVYINGVDSSGNDPRWAVPMSGNNYNTSIGYAEYGLGYLNGSMLACRLYNRSLSSAEVLQNYNNDLWRYKATPTILWTNPADITYGTALSSTQLNASASVPGSFVYIPPSGTILSAGTHSLHADFTPTDTANYTTTSKRSHNQCFRKPSIPIANFIANVTSGPAPLSVQFNDSSINATAWPGLWGWSDIYGSESKPYVYFPWNLHR